MKKIVLIFSMLLLSFLAACAPSSPSMPTMPTVPSIPAYKSTPSIDNPTNSNTSESSYTFVPDYTPGKANTRGNTINMLQNKGYFAIQDQWIYYCYANNIYKMPIGGGQNDIFVLYSDKAVKTIQVMGDWIYFLEEKDYDKWQIKRIRTDGAIEEIIVEDSDIVTSMWRVHSVEKFSAFIALDDWLYYISSTYGMDDEGNNTITYHITRKKSDGTKTENIYSFEPHQTGIKAYAPLIDYIDEDGTLYYYSFGGETQRYFAIDINGGEPKTLFSSLMQVNNKNTILFFFALDNRGNTYFTGYDFFDVDENQIKIKKEFAYPVYYLDGSLSSLTGKAIPVPLDNGLGIDREAPHHHLSFINGQLVTVSYNPKNPSDEQYELVRCDILNGEMTKITKDFPEILTHPYPEVFADLQDGFIYFGYDMKDTMWWRVKPDGTGLEELTWMLTPLSPKKPVTSRP